MARDDSLWLSFGGVRSDAMGVRVLRLPAPPAAAPRGALVEIPGRDGALWQDDGGLEAVSLTARLRLGSGADREAVAAWLRGAGALVLGDRPEFFHQARVLGEVAFSRDALVPGCWTAEVTFTCQPFRGLVNETAITLNEVERPFLGYGTVKALPELTVYGDGDIHLMVNGNTVLLRDVDDHITVDCDAKMAFRDGVNASGQVTLMGTDEDEDEWPSLVSGGRYNLVNWSGSVTRVVIQPHWRWR